MKEEKPFKCGYISIVGKPNVGKSTLMNSILGSKVSIISEKPQTTRNRIVGIKNFPDAQLIFLDTPGIHIPRRKLNEFMVEQAFSAMEDSDVILFMIDMQSPYDDEDRLVLNKLSPEKSVILVINKIDLFKKSEILPVIDEYRNLFNFKEIVPVSALYMDGLDILLNLIKNYLPEGPPFYPEDILTDQTERFFVAETIREKIYELTRQEIPFSTAVYVDEFKENAEKGIIEIRAIIYVERDSQKGILIGEKGNMIKEIGTRARKDLERFFGIKIFLDLWVKVLKNWSKDTIMLKKVGYR